MYYWNKVTENKTTLEEELLELEAVNEVYIGTAFFSSEGLRILKEIIAKYKLKKNRVKIYLSSEFSQDKPHELLEELNKLSDIYIIFDRTFHPKVYLLKGQECKVIYGSSNFTSGGYQKNIEFDFISRVSSNDLVQIEKFFGFCEMRAIKVTQDLIEYYRENAFIIEELKNSQKKIRKKLNGYIRQEDALVSDDLDIDNYYFNFQDYETFFIHNQKRSDVDIRKQRKLVQDKMLNIHGKIYPEIKNIGINCHWNPQHITSVIQPCEYNKGKVGWIGIRYGKTEEEVKALNVFLSNHDKDEIRGFQKHGCLQFCIVPKGLEINLFLAVKHDAIDRNYLEDKMTVLRPKIEQELIKLKGYGMVWEIYDESAADNDIIPFDIDSHDVSEFCPYLKKNNGDGRESYLKLFYSADAPRIKDEENLCSEIIKYMKLLLPLYNTMVWRPKVK